MDNIENLIASLSGETPLQKPAPHPLRLGLQWLALALAYLAVALTVSGVRTDLQQQLQQPWFTAELATLFGIFASTALSAAVLSFPDLYQRRALAFAPAWAFAVFVLVMLFAWHSDEPPAPLPMHSIECTMSILLFSLLPSAGIFYAMRRFASTHPRHSGVVAVLFAFSTGALWLRLYEPTNSVIHVIEWHYLPMIVVVAVGWKLGKSLLKW
jgi:hypothetical protein